jgi:hypothetical protein
MHVGLRSWKQESQEVARCGHFEDVFYSIHSRAPSAESPLKRVAAFSVVLFTKVRRVLSGGLSSVLIAVLQSFHPEKYGALTRLLADIYNLAGDPTQILRGARARRCSYGQLDCAHTGAAYLSVLTRDKLSLKTAKFSAADFPAVPVGNASLRGVSVVRALTKDTHGV